MKIKVDELLVCAEEYKVMQIIFSETDEGKNNNKQSKRNLVYQTKIKIIRKDRQIG